MNELKDRYAIKFLEFKFISISIYFAYSTTFSIPEFKNTLTAVIIAGRRTSLKNIFFIKSCLTVQEKACL